MQLFDRAGVVQFDLQVYRRVQPAYDCGARVTDGESRQSAMAVAVAPMNATASNVPRQLCQPPKFSGTWSGCKPKQHRTAFPAHARRPAISSGCKTKSGQNHDVEKVTGHACTLTKGGSNRSAGLYGNHLFPFAVEACGCMGKEAVRCVNCLDYSNCLEYSAAESGCTP